MTPALHIEWLGRIAYAPALARQDALVAAKIAAPDATPDALLLLEHDPVYTIGRTPDRSSLLSPDTLPHPVETIQRGGQATFHGPGQLVGYPIMDLSRRGRDLHRYLRFLEEVLIASLAAHGVAGRRREGLTGVWVGGKEDRVARRRRAALGQPARLCDQRAGRRGAEAVSRHHALRDRGGGDDRRGTRERADRRRGGIRPHGRRAVCRDAGGAVAHGGVTRTASIG